MWLNGRKLGTNSDPYAPFSLPATSLRPERPERAGRAGRQLRRPGAVPEDWWNWGGIVRAVTLEPAGRLRLRTSA